MVASISFAQTTLFEDDFEGFTVGDFVSTSDNWTTWSGNTGGSDDAIISDDYSRSTGVNSLKINTDEDIVYFCGDKATGVYQIKFWYYMPTGQGGYFNVQHDFANNWAFSVEMSDGNGLLTYDHEPAQGINFTFRQDAWVPIIMDVNLDDDEITLTIDAVVIETWQFSLTESDEDNLINLDCINFYGPSSVTPPYYIDNFEYNEIVPSLLPTELYVNVTELNSNGASQTFNITNTGENDLIFDTYAYYPSSAKNIPVTETPRTVTLTKNIGNNSLNQEILDKPIPVNLDTKDATLTHLTSEIATNLGWTNEITIHASALFDHEMIEEYVGMEVSSVIIFSGDQPIGTTSAEVWEGNNYLYNGPTDLMASEDFSPPAEAGQSNVTITSPVFVNGKDLWVGWTFTQPADSYCLAMGEAPGTDDVNFIKTSAAWSPINSPEYGNFGIVAMLTGEAIPTWLSVDVVEETTLVGGTTQNVIVTYDLTDLTPGETYNCTLVIDNNDADESWTEIPVSLTVPVNQTYTTTFTVTDGTDPIEGANVSIIENEYNTGTNTSGIATFGLEAGSYNYLVTASGYSDETGSFDISGVYSETVTLTLIPTYEITFTVTDNATTDPIQYAYINVNETNIITDIDGIATIELTDGDYPYNVTAGGYIYAEGNVVVDGSADAETIALDPIPTNLVTFTVFEQANNDVLIENAYIDIAGELIITDINGEATISLSDENYFFSVLANTYQEYDDLVEIAGIDLSVDVPLTSLVGIYELDNNLSIYPNPTSGFFNVVANENINQINVLNISGQMVKNISVNTNTYKVNTSDLQAGIYFFEITTNNQTITKKVIVK